MDANMQAFANIQAFNIYTFEDVSADEFLKASPNHIVLKSGERYYAFEREVLARYMLSKETWINKIGYVHQTPFTQFVPAGVRASIGWSHFTIFELIPTTEQGLESVHTVHCYSLTDPVGETYRPKADSVSLMDSLSRYTQLLINIEAHGLDYWQIGA